MLVFSGFGGRWGLAGPRSAALLVLLACGCVKLDNVFDCASLCDNRPHARTRCNGAGCIVEGCDNGYADCNQNTQDGCEVNLVVSREACGVCGNPCRESDCLEGACWSVEPLTDSTVFARGLALDADAVFFTSNDLTDAGPSLRGSGSLHRVPRLEGGEPSFVHWGLDSMGAIVLDSDAVYGFTSAFDSEPTSSGGTVTRYTTRVFRIPKPGGTVTFLGSTSLFASRPAVDDTDVYWPAVIDQDLDAGLLSTYDASDGQVLGAIAVQDAYGIAHASKLGGPVTAIPTPGIDAFDLVMQDGILFAASNGVQTFDRASQTTATLVADAFTSHVLVDATHVYWTAVDDATPRASLLKSMPLTGGTPTLLWRDATNTEQRPLITIQMVQDSDNIYLAESSGSVVRVPKIPGSATIIAGQQPCLSGVAVDGTFVYWSGCNGIHRVRISAFVR
jgi:hypothetical protein